MPAGRPTLYNDDILAKANEYLVNYKEYDDVIPMIAGLAIALDISRDTIYDWSKQEDKKEFSDIVRKIMQSQEKALLNGGLSNDFNASITKLALTKHGYSDKHQQELTGEIAIKQIERKIVD